MLRRTAIVTAVALSLFASSAFAAKTVVFCSEGSPEGFNPMFYTTGTTQDATSAQIFNRLVEFEVGTTNIAPSLAASWDISKDGLTYTFKLRRGVKFQTTEKFKPTRDFNADDVLFTWNRMADPANPFFKNTPGTTYAYFDDMGMSKIVDKVEKTDDYTVVFHLKHPEAPFLADLAMDFISIHSAEYAAKMKAAGTPEVIDREPVGTGPFQLASYQKDAVIRYKANPQYFEGKPKIDNLIFAITPDSSVRVAKMKAGECQLMAYPKPADVAVLKTIPTVNLLSKEGLNISYISFNVTKKPFDNKLVRQAVNYAINKKALVDTVFQGGGQVAKNLIPPIMWAYDDKIKDYEYSPEKAKALLAKAGLKDGFTMDMWYIPIQRPYSPDGKRMGEMLQADLAKVGIKVNLVTFEWGEYMKRAKEGEHLAGFFGWSGDNGDPDNFLHTLLGCDSAKTNGSNVAKFCNKEFDEAIKKAAATSDQGQRKKLYAKAQEIMHEEAPMIFIAHSLRYEPVAKSITGYKVASVPPLHYFSKVDVTK